MRKGTFFIMADLQKPRHVHISCSFLEDLNCADYCYPLTDDMLTVPMQKQSYVKCQILVGDVERDVIRKISRLRQPYFDEVIEKIKETIF